jgi:hypothetical protein
LNQYRIHQQKLQYEEDNNALIRPFQTTITMNCKISEK